MDASDLHSLVKCLCSRRGFVTSPTGSDGNVTPWWHSANLARQGERLPQLFVCWWRWTWLTGEKNWEDHSSTKAKESITLHFNNPHVPAWCKRGLTAITLVDHCIYLPLVWNGSSLNWLYCCQLWSTGHGLHLSRPVRCLIPSIQFSYLTSACAAAAVPPLLWLKSSLF